MPSRRAFIATGLATNRLPHRPSKAPDCACWGMWRVGGRQPKRPLPWRLSAMATGAIWWRGLFWPCASCQNVRQSLAPLGVPVALAYCTLCGSGILYEIKVAGLAKPFVFESSGFLCRSNRLMFVRATLSLWNQFARAYERG